MIAVVEAMAESVLHVVLSTLGDVPTCSIPEPLETVLGTVVPLCSVVESSVSFQRFEMLNLTVLEVLQQFLVGSRLQL